MRASCEKGGGAENLASVEDAIRSAWSTQSVANEWAASSGSVKSIISSLQEVGKGYFPMSPARLFQPPMRGYVSVQGVWGQLVREGAEVGQMLGIDAARPEVVANAQPYLRDLAKGGAPYSVTSALGGAVKDLASDGMIPRGDIGAYLAVSKATGLGSTPMQGLSECESWEALAGASIKLSSSVSRAFSEQYQGSTRAVQDLFQSVLERNWATDSPSVLGQWQKLKGRLDLDLSVETEDELDELVEKDPKRAEAIRRALNSEEGDEFWSFLGVDFRSFSLLTPFEKKEFAVLTVVFVYEFFERLDLLEKEKSGALGILAGVIICFLPYLIYAEGLDRRIAERDDST